MEKRTQKQLFIGLIFILIIGGAGYGLVDRFFILEPTCFDGIQNGLEEGVDCGILACGFACEEEVRPIEVSLERHFEIRPLDYDFVALLSNPNSNYGASKIDYSLILLRNDSGQGNPELATMSGSTYILPGQTKYLVLTSLRPPEEIGGTQLVINSVQWENLDMPSGIVNLINRRGQFVNLNDESYFEGAVFNDSDFDFDRVDVSVILFDSSNTVIGVNRTEIRTLLSRTERAFRTSWPFVRDNVARTEVEVSTNLFENSNFIRSYGTQERFQRLY